MKSYTDFAAFYDTLTENVEYEQKADYLMELFKRHNHTAGLTLDLACGTGTLTLALKKRGIDIYGVDASCEMLTVAQQKAYAADEKILFLCQKMQRLNLYGTVDTCICTLDSINHLTKLKDVEDTFERVALFLNPNGLFVFDANTIYKHTHILGDNCYIYDTKPVFCAWQNNYDPSEHCVTITLDFFEPIDGAYCRSSEQFSERAYRRDELERLWTAAGFVMEAVYGEGGFEPPHETTQREIYVLRKKENE